MINALQSIVDMIVSFGMFLGHTITSLINLVKHIPTYVSFLTVSIGYLPTMIMPFCIASVSIYVVFMIVNRGK